MPVVAVAGGTGGIGRTIVEEIVATGKHEVKILSRKVSIVITFYADHALMVRAQP